MKKEKMGKKLVFSGIVVALIIAAIVRISIYNAPANRLSRQLDLGQKYLVEQDYEQAIVEFDKAIAIDPMNVEAYLGKADAYVNMGDYDSAIAALEAGYQATAKDAVIKDKLVSCYLEYADTYRQAGDLAVALEILQKGYELTGDERLQALILEIQGEIVAREAAEEARKQEEEKSKLLDLGFSIEDFYVAGIHVYDMSMEGVITALNAVDSAKSGGLSEGYIVQYLDDKPETIWRVKDGAWAYPIIDDNLEHVFGLFGGQHLDLEPCIEAPIKHGDPVQNLLGIEEGNHESMDGTVRVEYWENDYGKRISIYYYKYDQLNLTITYKDNTIDFWDIDIFY